MVTEDSSKPGKFLLVTSDDFGMCHAINTGITRATLDGIVRSTAFMVPCPWFAQAAQLARKHNMKVGVHLCVTCEWDNMRWGPITKAPSLVDSEGYFPRSFAELNQTAKDEEIFSEYEAQIARVRATGFEPTHIDHHMLPARNYEPYLLRFKAIQRRVCEKHDILQVRAHDPMKGHLHMVDEFETSGRHEAECWAALERWTKPGVYELISHAAVPTTELDALSADDNSSRYWGSPYRVADLVFLTRPSTRRRIEEMGFQLIDVPTLKRLIKK